MHYYTSSILQRRHQTKRTPLLEQYTVCLWKSGVPAVGTHPSRQPLNVGRQYSITNVRVCFRRRRNQPDHGRPPSQKDAVGLERPMG